MMNHAWLIYSNNYPRNHVLSCEDLRNRVSSPLLLGTSMARASSTETEKSRLYRSTGWQFWSDKTFCWLRSGMFCHSACAVGSYSSGPAAANAIGTKSTGGFFRPELSPCMYFEGKGRRAIIVAQRIRSIYIPTCRHPLPLAATSPALSWAASPPSRRRGKRVIQRGIGARNNDA